MSRRFVMDDTSQRIYRMRWYARPRPRPRRVYFVAAWWGFTFVLNAIYLEQMIEMPRASEPITTLPLWLLLFSAVPLFCWEMAALLRRRSRALRIFEIVLWVWSWMLGIQLLIALWEDTWSLTGGWAGLLLLAANIVAIASISGLARR